MPADSDSSSILYLITGLRDSILNEIEIEYNKSLIYKLLPAQGAVLCALSKKKQSMRDVSAKILRNQSSITPIVQSLENRKLIVRTESEKDRRITLVNLTESGVIARKEILRLSRRIHLWLFSGTTTKDRSDLFRILGRMRENLIQKQKHRKKNKNE
ncbi:MarR family transcriptional regulator [Leptospira gomenensis]|uniref:MarR family transcriptional regulator n=1 Tax=Leptospira gomenensis TaxID=2484974 RepID=A0A5F1Z1L5_9LEPT|nr:MarR family winged helix-turn-helix transcriptional regulator [Leptospira gomenensis]TGK33774.1 MarR family transcriptional regulator [Leptospira gomenensis]TGK38697.1 MarR family transcriptional regulator [Leptospira gomenensis]TGK40584.1 MarR family transcriptional regulator [Leptospira gomenensis]TGK65334.1 MarR family transcriptional regulator [Leptospira gomenensis]